MNTIKIKLIKSPIGKPEAHRKTVQALGLKKGWKNNRKKVIPPQIRGMIEQVKYMVEVVE